MLNRLRGRVMSGLIVILTPVLIAGAPLAVCAQEATPATGATPEAAANEAEFTRIANETADLRGLPRLTNVVDEVISPEQFRAGLPAMLAEDTTPEEIANETRGLIAIGLLPPGTDLEALSLDLLGEQVAGYYDPRTDEMFVINRSGEFSPEDEFTYSHEITHALQDAWLDPDDVMEATLDENGDEASAITALYEGDAVLTSLDYLQAHPDLALALASAPVGSSDTLDRVPGALALSLLFPYIDGLTFVQALRDEGGLDAVNAAYANRPQSTEQIMHPEKYFAGEAPVAVSLPDAEEAMGSGWSLADEDTLGEFGIELLLADLQPGEGINAFTGEFRLPEPATNAAAGWGGDRYALWVNGAQEALVWDTVWDTESDALAFARALQRQTERRFSGIYEGESMADTVLQTDEVTTHVALDGARVRYVQAADPATASTALAALQ